MVDHGFQGARNVSAHLLVAEPVGGVPASAGFGCGFLFNSGW